MRRLAVGLTASLASGMVALLGWGRAGAFGAVVFGLVATALQLVAHRLVTRRGGEASIDRPALYGVGVVLRLAGVVMLGVAVTRNRERFPPLPSALGYLGTVLPLLYLETRPKQ